MNENRRHAIVELDSAAILELTSQVFPGKSLSHFSLLSEGLCNTNYRFAMNGSDEPFVLRIYVRDPSACDREAQIHQLVGGRLPVAKFLHVDSSCQLVSFPYSITTFVPGITMREALKSYPSEGEIIAAAAGELLSRVAELTFPAAGRFGSDLTIERWPWDTGGELDTCSRFILSSLEHPRVCQRLGLERKKRIIDFVHSNRHYLQAIEGEARLVHGDFNRSNIVVERVGTGWAVRGLLDWEWSHSGAPLMDVGNMLRDIGHLSPAFEPSFIRGFREGGGVLPEHWKKISMLIDMTNHCEFLENREEGNAFIPACLSWIDKTMDGWESYH